MFLDNLERLIKARGLNNHSFSQQSGIPYMTIKNFWEKGCDNVKLTTLKKIADFFGVSLDYLIFGNEYLNANINITKDEQNLVLAYRNHPEMQPAINKMLDIEDNINTSDKYSASNASYVRIAAKGQGAIQKCITDEQKKAISDALYELDHNNDEIE